MAELLRESESPQLTLSFEKSEEERITEHLEAFIKPEDLEELPSRYRKTLEHAITLFHFHEKKQSISFAPVFQPLLGPIDDAAEVLIRERLSADVPAPQAAQKDFFEPDMGSLNKDSSQYLKERARSLKRLLVHQSPIMPVGMLNFCLEYASKDTKPLDGLFKSVRKHFADLAKTNLPNLLNQVYDFRNLYIAHAKEELTNADTTRTALKIWGDALQTLFAAQTTRTTSFGNQ